MWREMQEQPEVLARLVARWEQDVERVQDLLSTTPVGVEFVGRGSSDNAAVLGRYAVELCGVPGSLAAPSLVTRYDVAPRRAGHLVVGLSQSGATPEILTVCASARGSGAVTVAITNDRGSALPSGCALTLALEAGPERAVPATKTVTASMLAVLAVGTAVARSAGRPDPMTHAQLRALPGAVAGLVDDGAPLADLAHRWVGHDRLQVTGRGIGYAAVLETALKVKETTGVFAQGLSVADLLHGPISALDSCVPVVLIDTGGPGSRDVRELHQRLAAGGADTSLWSSEPGADVLLPAGLPEPLAVIAATVRGQQLALRWALAADRDPDRPVGLSKVTVTR
jgi:glucosamine--fructose-6-phosphate aminotransferase (isomerizing)